MKRLYFSFHRPTGGGVRTAEIRALFDRVRAVTPTLYYKPHMDPFPDDPRIKAVRFSGIPFGQEYTVFAYLGFPEGASPDAPVPGMVLAHGGAGHAYAEWVQSWVDRGYAAISFDGFGQTYTGAQHSYDADLKFWGPDPEAHPPMTGFENVMGPLLEQGFTFYIADVLLAHSVLRADQRTDKDKIGLTGISWGGIAAGVAVGLDGRFAFAAPVYGCGFLDAGKSAWGEYFRRTNVVDVWDAKHLLDSAPCPVRYFNGDGDPFFDAAAVTASAAACPQGSLTLLPGFTHGQIEGSSIPELFRFADAQTGRGDRNIRIDALSAAGENAELRFTLPGDVKAAEACIYYKTEDLVYDDKYLREPWKRAAFAAENGRAAVPIPEKAYLFYFCVEGKTDGPAGVTLHATTGVFDRAAWDAAEINEGETA